jgi:hypothetical protein
MRCARAILLIGISWVWIAPSPASAAEAEPKYRSHLPVRPLPAPSSRPQGKGPASFVDPAKGADRNDGSQPAPWKTINHALKQLKPGDTLYLRGGTYYESVGVGVSGRADSPITIRAFPGELAIIDGGLREFFEKP